MTITRAGKVKPWQKLKQELKKVLLFIRRPLRVTCADCGFLAFGNDEAHEASRTLLGAKGSAGLPGRMEDLQCYRSQWVQYDLTYFDHSVDGQLDEVAYPRHCKEFLRYKPGLSPKEHMQCLSRSEERKAQFWYTFLAALLAAVLTLAGQTGRQWLAKFLGLTTPSATSTNSRK